MTLGEKIRIARAKKKISQQELSEKAGTHQKNISKYEKELVVTTDYLQDNDNASIKDMALLKQFKEVDNLPDSEKSSLMNVISAYIRDFKTRQAYVA